MACGEGIEIRLSSFAMAMLDYWYAVLVVIYESGRFSR